MTQGMKRIHKLWHQCITMLVLLCSSGCCMAAGATTPNKFVFFALADNDKSIKLLSDIFGQVPWVLETGQQHTILHEMFLVFNSALLLFAFLVFAYTIIKFAVSAASTGELMEQGMSSIWVLIRGLIGILLLIPTKASYVVIQVIMMWIIIEGIGLADNIWNEIVDYVGPNTPVISPLNLTPSSSKSTILASNVLYSTLCRQRIVALEATASAPYTTTTLPLSEALPPPTATQTVLDNGSTLIEYQFTPAGSDADCGSIEYIIPNPDEAGSTNAANAEAARADAIKAGLSGMVNTLNNTAIEYIFNNEDATKVTLPNPVLLSAQHLEKLLEEVSKGEASNQKNLDAFWTNAKNTGWIYAGAYYYAIAILNNKFGEFAEPGDVQYISPNTSEMYHTTADTHFVEDLFNYAAYASFQPSDDNVTGGIEFNTGETGGAMGYAVGGVNWVVDFVTKHIVQLFIPLVQGFNTGQFEMGGSKTIAGSYFPGSATGQVGNPLIQLQVFGKQMVNFLKLAWVMIIVASFALQLMTGFCAGLLPFSAVVPVVINYITIPALLLLGILYVSALILANYVPLIPFIIFFFAIMGWILSTMETFIAAPLVAIALISQKPNQMFGGAEPAFNLLMNVFLRPTLMLFGLIAGMIVSSVFVDFLNSVFGKVMISASANSNVGGIELAMQMLIYVSMIVTILNRSYMAIADFPNWIIGWIGQAVPFGEHLQIEEVVKETRAKAEETAEQPKQFLAPLEQMPEGGFKKGTEMGRTVKRKLTPGGGGKMEKIKTLSEKGGSGGDEVGMGEDDDGGGEVEISGSDDIGVDD